MHIDGAVYLKSLVEYRDNLVILFNSLLQLVEGDTVWCECEWALSSS